MICYHDYEPFPTFKGVNEDENGALHKCLSCGDIAVIGWINRENGYGGSEDVPAYHSVDLEFTEADEQGTCNVCDKDIVVGEDVIYADDFEYHRECVKWTVTR